MSSTDFFNYAYFDYNSPYLKTSGPGRVLNEGEQLPTRAPVSLTDLLVHKKSGSKNAKSSKAAEFLSECDATDNAARDDPSNHVKNPLRGDVQSFFESVVQQDLTSPNRYIYDHARARGLDSLFESPSKPFEREGQLRYATHSNGDLSVLQWTTFPGLAWQHVGRIDGAQVVKFSAFTSLLNHDNCKDANGIIDPFIVQHYAVAMVKQLSKDVPPIPSSVPPRGPASPLSRAITKNSIKSSDSRLSEISAQFSTPPSTLSLNPLPYSTGSSVHKQDTLTAEEASAKRKALIEECNLQFGSADPFVNEAPTISSFYPQQQWQNPFLEQNHTWKERGGLFNQDTGNMNPQGFSYNEASGFHDIPRFATVDRKTDLTYSSGFQEHIDHARGPLGTTRLQNPLNESLNFRSSIPKASYQLPQSTMSISESQMGKDHRASLSTIESQGSTKFPLANGSKLAQPQASREKEATPSRDPYADPYNRPLHTRDVDIPTPRNMDWSMLRDHTPLRPEMVTRPIFENDRLHMHQEPEQSEELRELIKETDEKAEAAYRQNLEDFWNSGKKQISRQDGLIKHTLAAAGQSDDEEARRALALFTPACENLEYYAKLPMKKTEDGGYKRTGDYFSRYAAQSWLLEQTKERHVSAIKPTSLLAALDGEPLKTYWQEVSDGIAVPKRDPRSQEGNAASTTPSSRVVSQVLNGGRATSSSNSTSDSSISKSENIRMPGALGMSAAVGGINTRTGAASTAAYRALPYPAPLPVGQRGGGYGL